MKTKKTELTKKTTQMTDNQEVTPKKLMLSMNEKLSNALTEKGYSHTQGQIEYVLNCKHELTFNKRFCELMNASIYMQEMIETFLNLSNLTKFESDFRNL